MTDDVAEKVLGWLHTTGYPFELRVGRQLADRGWHVNYSRWYRDSSTGKPREVDIQAIVGAVNRNRSSVFASLCFECKTSAQPWVGLRGSQSVPDRLIKSCVSGPMSEMTLVGAEQEGITLPDILPASMPLVAGLITAHVGDKKSKDDSSPSSPYSALLQARSGALALDLDYKALAEETTPDYDPIALFVPVVVLRGRLFTYSLDQTMTEKLEEVGAVVASVAPEPDHESAMIPVVTEAYLEANTDSWYRELHGFCVAALPHASSILGAVRIADLVEEGQHRGPAA